MYCNQYKNLNWNVIILVNVKFQLAYYTQSGQSSGVLSTLRKIGLCDISLRSISFMHNISKTKNLPLKKISKFAPISEINI